MEKVYKGKIIESAFEEGSGIYLEDDEEYMPLAEHIDSDMYRYGRYLSVSYYIANKNATEGELQENYLKRILGMGNATIYCTYSDYTGYLWTTEKIEVGGHNLLDELQNNIDKFLYLKIRYSKEEFNKT